MRGTRSRSLAAGLALLPGCAYVVAEPAFPAPERPPLAFFLIGRDVCLSEEDGNALARYLEKLNALEAARERLQEGGTTP